jgi:hypothetical protein
LLSASLHPNDRKTYAITPGQTQLILMLSCEYCLSSIYRAFVWLSITLTSIASLFVIEMTAAFEAQYAASSHQQWWCYPFSSLGHEVRTCIQTAHNPQLTGDVHNTPPISRSSIMSWQWFLLEHLRKLCS